MNSKTTLLVILIVLISLSKEILVFNEEVLVLFSFFVFISLVYHFLSFQISCELDSRSNKIREEFIYYKDLQKNILAYLISYHNKQRCLLEEIKNILLSTKRDILYIKTSYSKLFLKFLLNAIEDKFKKVLSNESKFDSLLQNKINSDLYNFLISKYTLKKNKSESSTFLMDSLNFLSNSK
jgi:F0F1-type ATP synthase membrane subunit b/b'